MSLTCGAYLMHHGRKGQKWGEQNGPPYPLNFDDLSPEERAKAKQESIDKGDTVTAEANIKYYSAKEIDDLIIKNNKNKQLSSINGTDITKGEKFIKKFVKGAGMYVEVVDKGSKVYNVTAKVSNAFGLTNLPIIGEKSKDEIELEKLRLRKDMKKAQNELTEELKKERKLSGKDKDEAEEKLKALKKETERLELEARQAEALKKKRDAKPKEEKDDEDAIFKKETQKMNNETARITAEANRIKAELAKEEQLRAKRKSYPRVEAEVIDITDEDEDEKKKK